ncbi:MAG: GH116 family glycosyl-hydrolase [Anaerolineae bacterium]
MKDDTYSQSELYEFGAPRAYEGAQLAEIAFPIGGIGTGSVSLSGTGALRDWEIFNRPNIGSLLPYSFLTLWAQAGGEAPVTRVVQSPPRPPFSGQGATSFQGYGFGVSRLNGAGFPHLRQGTFHGEYPLAWIEFQDPDVPLQVTLHAYNPFIPLNDKDSGLPAAILQVELHNLGNCAVQVALAANLYNAVGYPGEGSFSVPDVGGSTNAYLEREGIRGLFMSSGRYAEDDPRFGSMALTTPWPAVDHQTSWFRGSWYDAFHKFWDEFSSSGTLSERIYDTPAPEGQGDVGSIVLQAAVEPGATVTLPVYITWHFPNFVKYWGRPSCDCQGEACARPGWKNYYATWFDDAFEVASYLAANAARLEAETRLFHDTLFASTLPTYVLDAVSSQMSTLKTTTCLRLEDGTFYGFEGCHTTSGCCEGSCTHVWNYAQTSAFLFPALERSMRSADYAYNVDPDGRMGFRLQLPLGSAPSQFHAAADGQMGGMLKVYRDWKLSGDDAWLCAIWPQLKRALAYAWAAWDIDRDGVMEGVQHNTYDIEFWGPNTMMGSFYMGALRAAEEMARYLGEDAQADAYRVLYEQGRAKMDADLFNGEYYVQQVNPQAYKSSPLALDESMGGQIPDAPKYQYGEGCLSDQLIGQWVARIVGLGDLFDLKHVRSALRAIHRHNWRADFWDHANPQRIYALNDEQGLLLCTWPHGGRPELPFVYSDEVWCGIEYQVASHLIYEGLLEEGLSIVKGVRVRHDGARRNPWNEFECGSHYARSMASWAVLTALSGYEFDVPNGRIGFTPRLRAGDFRTFWSLDSGWGSYTQRSDADGGQIVLSVAYGELKLQALHLGSLDEVRSAEVTVDGHSVAATLAAERVGWTVLFSEPLILKAGQCVTIRVR